MRKFVLSGVLVLLLATCAATQDKKPSPLTADQNKQITNLQRAFREAETRKRAADAELQTIGTLIEAQARQFFIDNKVDSDVYAPSLTVIGNSGDVFGFVLKAKPEPKPEPKKE